jgi:hypothetical protein
MKHRPGKARSLPPLPSTALAPPEVRLANQSVMRTEWRDPTDNAPSAARVAKAVTGYRQYCPLRKCRANRGERSNYTVEHVLAADRLRQLADGVAIGFSPGREFIPVQVIRYGPLSGFGQAAVRSAHAWPAYRRAMALFDQGQRELLAHCLLLNWSLRRWVEELRTREQSTNPIRERQRLVACLDLLVEHFKSEIEHDLGQGAVVV